jgi:hypothetical protein
MLQSNSQYLEEKNGWRQRVNISCENFTHPVRPFEPGSVLLKIRYLDSDANYYPDEFTEETETFTTEIIVEFKAKAANETLNDAVRLGVTKGTGKATIDWGDGNVEYIHVSPVTATNAEGFSHTYPEPGNYQARITAFSEVSYIRFSTVTSTESYPVPVTANSLTRIIKVKSSSLTSLDYMFAGQAGCANLESSFELETPKVSSLQGTFFGCGMTQLPGSLLNRIKTTRLFWTFRQMRLTSIHVDLFAGMISEVLNNTVDLFRDNPLTSYPATLLRNCSKLQGLEGMFNHTFVSGNVRHIPATLLQGSDARDIRYLFYNAIWIQIPKNFLQYTPNVSQMDGVFDNARYQYEPPLGFEMEEGNSNDLNEIFPAASYPAMRSMTAAFVGAGPKWPMDFLGDALTFVRKFPNIYRPNAGQSDNPNNRDGRIYALHNLDSDLYNTDNEEVIPWL